MCLLIHADDVIILSNDRSVGEAAKRELLLTFEGVNQGDLKSFCGVQVNIDSGGISLSMKYYWEKIMKKFVIADWEAEAAPITSKVFRDDRPEVPEPALKNDVPHNYWFCNFWVHPLSPGPRICSRTPHRVMHSPSITVPSIGV